MVSFWAGDPLKIKSNLLIMKELSKGQEGKYQKYYGLGECRGCREQRQKKSRVPEEHSAL
jgi:hypothetical protein